MARDYMRQNHVRIFFLLDILTGRQYIRVDYVFDLAALCPQQSDGRGAVLPGQQQRIDGSIIFASCSAKICS